ncbi:MAG TPA: hypothetical protein PLW44_10585 [Chitinophagales bacterium]|nr:hypothetical protein [Chitinophagales bacterium]
MQTSIKYGFGLIVLIAMLYAADCYYYYVTATYHTDKAQVIMRISNIRYDYIMVGSSRTECFFNTAIIDSITGLKGYNLGLDGSEFAESYLLLDQFLKHNNKVKVVFIQADIFQMLPDYSYSYPFHEYRYLPFINDATVAATVKEKRGILKYVVWRYVPFIKYAEFNTEYSIEDVVSKYNNKPYLYANNGFRYLSTISHSDSFVDKRYTEERINTKMSLPDGNPYLDKIIALLKDNGCQPVLIQPPVYAGIEKWARQFDIKDEARKSNVPYCDYLSVELSTKGSLFRDYTHLDGKGAIIFSTQIADSIKTVVKQYSN